MSFDKTLRDGQPETRTTVLSGCSIVMVEGIKNSLMI